MHLVCVLCAGGVEVSWSEVSRWLCAHSTSRSISALPSSFADNQCNGNIPRESAHAPAACTGAATHRVYAAQHHTGSTRELASCMHATKSTSGHPKHSMCDPKHSMWDPKHSMCDPKHSMCDPKHSMWDPKQDTLAFSTEHIDLESSTGIWSVVQGAWRRVGRGYQQ